MGVEAFLEPEKAKTAAPQGTISVTHTYWASGTLLLHKDSVPSHAANKSAAFDQMFKCI